MHKHLKDKRWLTSHPRYRVDYTPTYTSWLKPLEICLIPIKTVIRRGTFRSVKGLILKIGQFVQQYNLKTHPLFWAETPDSILQNIKQHCRRITETRH